MSIRRMSANQIEQIKTLWESLNVHHLSRSTNFKDHFSRLTFENRMEVLRKRDSLTVFVAEDEGKAVGYCIATVDGVAGEVDSLFVKESYRGKGLGEELVCLALEWLEQQSCEVIKVAVAEGNENVLGFYRKFGFAERLIVMQRTHNK